jgi:hypothetical protein
MVFYGLGWKYYALYLIDQLCYMVLGLGKTPLLY